MILRQAKAVAFTFLIVGIALAGAGLLSYRKTRNFVSNSVRTTAVVVELEYRSGSGGNGGYVPVLSFVDELGQMQTARGKSTQNPAPVDVGQTVKILCNSGNPDSVRIDSFNGLWFTTFLLSAGGVATFAMGLIALVSIHRMSRDEER